MAYKLSYLNKGTRNQPLSPDLERIYEQAALKAAIDEIRVMSGGQPSSGPNRTGSHRHDEGGAGDIQLVRGGNVLDFTNPEHLPYIQNWISAASQGGLTGFGAGEGYMGRSTIHAGGGTPATWGPGGSGSTAPAWLQKAVQGVQKGLSLDSNPVTMASTETPAAEEANPLAGGLEDIISGLNPKAQDTSVTEITPASISGEPAAPNPAAAQMLAGLLQDRRKRYGGGILA